MVMDLKDAASLIGTLAVIAGVAFAVIQLRQHGRTRQREAALEAIRSVAPVGIGAALSVQDGYPVINNLVPGTPAELSGQLRVGDRVVAIAQGNDAFVDARNLGLSNIVQMIRGAPNTVVQLQVLPANASPNSPPQIVPLVRGQINFKK